MIGYFGDTTTMTIFEVSDRRILTPSALQRSKAGRYHEHERIGLRPLVERVGSGLDSVSFSLLVSAALGIKPFDELAKWRKMAEESFVGVLVIGDKIWGADHWLVESISETYDTIMHSGAVFSASLDVTLKEYLVRI